ncbi:pogo transposable [Pyrenophora seminiperda CCB06]|uniref:Pogo transposable n=1 Tax=Pyrenophora seminiperda CCB06 TaxID=1302712 RepID=A0A3M7M3E4_9PLEO|nr:pogo transposable [Pyrenophora seminiperda CCB06]
MHATPFFPHFFINISTTTTGIEAAIAVIESLKLGDHFIYTNIAAKYDCDRSTLSRRHQGLTTAHNSTCNSRINSSGSISFSELIVSISIILLQ